MLKTYINLYSFSSYHSSRTLNLGQYTSPLIPCIAHHPLCLPITPASPIAHCTYPSHPRSAHRPLHFPITTAPHQSLFIPIRHTRAPPITPALHPSPRTPTNTPATHPSRSRSAYRPLCLPITPAPHPSCSRPAYRLLCLPITPAPVSYTHLTLPTIYSV